MIITVLGFDNNSYTKKETGELIEGLTLYYSKPNKSANGVGATTGSEYVSGKAFPEQFKAIVKAGASIIGKKLSISKDVRVFNGVSRATLDELEILE